LFLCAAVGQHRIRPIWGRDKLRTDNKKVRFEINVSAAEKAGLKLSSKLLKLAMLVADAPRGQK
jgi:hypothetical protein